MTRFFASFVLVASLTALLSGCGEDPPPPYADIRWKLRCQDMGGCTGYLGRDINNYNGEMGRRISCEIQQRSGGAKEFFFSAFQGSEYGIELRNAGFMGAGGAVGGTCLVRVTEDGSRWVGTCGSSPPSAAQPCQISNFRIEAGMGVLGGIFCQGMNRDGDPTTLRELTSPDEPATMPAAFNLNFCAGL